jgi:hypothetical protein
LLKGLSTPSPRHRRHAIRWQRNAGGRGRALSPERQGAHLVGRSPVSPDPPQIRNPALLATSTCLVQARFRSGQALGELRLATAKPPADNAKPHGSWQQRQGPRSMGRDGEACYHFPPTYMTIPSSYMVSEVPICTVSPARSTDGSWMRYRRREVRPRAVDQ